MLLQQDAWRGLGNSLWAVPTRNWWCVTHTHTHPFTHTSVHNVSHKTSAFCWHFNSCFQHSMPLRPWSSAWTGWHSRGWVLQLWSDVLNIKKEKWQICWNELAFSDCVQIWTSVWIILEFARMEYASTQMALSDANAPLDTTWITLESTVLVSWLLDRCSVYRTRQRQSYDVKGF